MKLSRRQFARAVAALFAFSLPPSITRATSLKPGRYVPDIEYAANYGATKLNYVPVSGCIVGRDGKRRCAIVAVDKWVLAEAENPHQLIGTAKLRIRDALTAYWRAEGWLKPGESLR